MKRRHIMGISVIVIFLAFSMLTLRNSLTPYATFAQAKSMNSGVQVRGTVVANSIAPGKDARTLNFILRDESGEEVSVVYSGVRPEGLEAAESVVAVGRYGEGRFTAERLLVKCPSKYQGSVKKE